jgi:hypothetical protein
VFVAARLTADLFVDDVPRGLAVLVDDREILRFTADARHVTAHLTLPNRSRVPVSRSPTTVVTTVTDAALARRADPAAWTTVLARHLSSTWSVRGPATHPVGQGALAGIVLSATHPALAPAVGAGLEPTVDVPSWASAALRQNELAGVSRQLFGSTTRAVDAALGALLTHPLDGQLPWWTLAVTAAAAGSAEADDLASALTARVFVDRMPAVEDVRHVRQLFALFERDDVVRLLRDGLRDPAGLAQLMEVARRAADVGRVPHSDRPRGLDELVLFIRSFTRTPVPAAVAQAADEQRPAHPTPQPPAPARAPEWRAARQAPERGPVRADRFDELRVALDGYAAGDVVLEAPRSEQELRTWAALLQNCLASFEPAVRARRSLVLAVRRDGRLEAALEIDPAANRLRQFHGPRNRAPAPATRSAVLRVLRAHGVRAG